MAADSVRFPGSAASVHPLAPRPYVVRSVTAETRDTVTLEMVPESGPDAPPFSPGQFNMVYRFGQGEVAISISGDPMHFGRLSHTVRAVGAITTALTRLRPGEVVGVRGPYGTGWPMGAAVGKDVVVIGGGLGVAPLRPVITELLAHRERYGRIEIILGARAPAEILYYSEIQRWRGRSDARIQVTVDSAGRDWNGDVGVVTQRLPDARFDPASTVGFLCGPEIMMRLGAEALTARGVPAPSLWLSMERNMKCAVAMCGHCQLGPDFICREGPVLNYAHLRPFLAVRDV